MTRFVPSAAVLFLLAATWSIAAEQQKTDNKQSDSQAKDAKQCFHATISKFDSENGKLTVTCYDKSGQSHDKTLQLSQNVAFKDDSGKTAERSDFKAGDHVAITEQDGKVTEIKEINEAEITKVDPIAGTVTLKMEDKNGKETERTFHLVREAEYIDSTGRVASLDVFRSGDKVLCIEAEGRIQSMKKSDDSKSAGKTASSKNKAPSSSTDKK